MNILCQILGVTCMAGTITGHAAVWDGDTLYVANQPVRLAGIDAEELDEPNGRAARDHLRYLVGDSVVTCRWDGWSYRRRVAICTVGLPSQRDAYTQLNAQMVADGFALDCAHYSKGLYRQLEPTGSRARLIQKPYC